MKQTFKAKVINKDHINKAIEIGSKGFYQTMINKFQEGKDVWITVDERKPARSGQQNNALHLWFSLVADELNLAGYTVQLVMKEKIDLDWDASKVKELLWRPSQVALTGKKSTTELSKVSDIDIVWEHLNRHLGEKFGLHVPFPSEEHDVAELTHRNAPSRKSG